MTYIKYIDEGEDGMIDSIIHAVETTQKMMKGEWSEALHPRDEQGKFSDSHGATEHPEFLKDHLKTGTKLIVSGERTGLSPEVNAARTKDIKDLLTKYAHEIVPQVGHWGGTTENSFIASVRPLDVPKLEKEIFERFGREAYIHLHNGQAELRFQNGTKQVGQVDDLQVVPDATDNYSQIGTIKYQLNFKEQS